MAVGSSRDHAGVDWTHSMTANSLSVMDSEQIYGRLTPLFREVFDDDDLVPVAAMTAKDVAEWDSLNHIRLMVAIEKAFRVHFTTAEVSGFPDVGRLVEAIAAKLSAEGRQVDS
jgi:acyl carrier protein